MNKKLLYSPLGLFIVITYFLLIWSNDDLCGWMDSTSIPEYILDEVHKREILCYGGIEVSTLTESNSYESIELFFLHLTHH